ncbi:MAG: hypothetical protein KGI71_04830 [Patescibacteria group bacterium]|nr:hypothetical protein [Patescibacteria group bacterium]
MKKLALVVALSLLGCLTPRTPAQQAADALAAINCVKADWGKPVGVVAADCLQSELTAAEDAIADVEAIIEGTAILAGQDVGKVQAAFPYASEPRIVAAVAAKRDAYVAQQKALVGK